jgi:hypothetical protein
VEPKRCWGKDVARDLGIQKGIAEFVSAHRIESVVVIDSIIGSA